MIRIRCIPAVSALGHLAFQRVDERKPLSAGHPRDRAIRRSFIHHVVDLPCYQEDASADLFNIHVVCIPGWGFWRTGGKEHDKTSAE